MALIQFWEKPGCGGNARQKALLQAAGHQLEVHSLLSWPWQAETLRPFFGSLPVSDWFNRASPRIKSGEVVPENFQEAEAIAAMLADPLLIRRPLMQVGDSKHVGFDAATVDAWVGLSEIPAGKTEGCPREGMAPCPTPHEA